AVLVLGPFLSLASALAPTHAHESTTPHQHALVHSHFEPHEVGAAHDHDGPEFEPGEEHIVWLDGAISCALPYQLPPPAAPVVAVFDAVPVAPFWSVTAIDEAAPP